MSDYLWGIDLGGTKIEGVVFNKDNHEKVLFRDRVPTGGANGYEHVLGQINKVIHMMEEAAGTSCEILGIGTPGTMDPHTQFLKNSNSTILNGKPFHADLEKLTGKSLIMANDANCFALAESKIGIANEIAPNAEVVFGVIMGTGVGGGVVAHGKVINGHQGIAGEWGHNFLHESGGPCYCGKSGCIETVLAGPSLEKYYASQAGEKKKLKDIVSDAQHDKHAGNTLDRLHHYFGMAISTIINVLDPEVIVIGGGVGNIKSIYTEGFEKAKEYVFNSRLDTKIVAPKLGDSAGVYGAAFLTASNT